MLDAGLYDRRGGRRPCADRTKKVGTHEEPREEKSTGSPVRGRLPRKKNFLV